MYITLNDNTYNFLNCRPDDTKIYLINEFQKYTNIKAIRKRNENEFIDKLTWSLAGIIVVSSILITIRQPKPAKPDCQVNEY